MGQLCQMTMIEPDITTISKADGHRERTATFIALAFHVSGLIAIGFFQSPLFISLTPLNLLVCLGLIFWTQRILTPAFWVFAVIAFGIGFGAEYIGVNYGWLFGNYSYGQVLGPKWGNVPWMIGVQWLVTMYCSGVAMNMLHHRLMRNQPQAYGNFPRWLMTLSVVADGAFLAVMFDWIIEPVAIRLGYWTWADNLIPWSNYVSWWGVSMVILFNFHFLPFRKHNLFAVHLLLIQSMFFLVLRTLLSFGLM